MSFNVLPNGRNVLHYFGDGTINDTGILLDIFKTAKTGLFGRKFYVPFFED